MIPLYTGSPAARPEGRQTANRGQQDVRGKDRRAHGQAMTDERRAVEQIPEPLGLEHAASHPIGPRIDLRLPPTHELHHDEDHQHQADDQLPQREARQDLERPIGRPDEKGHGRAADELDIQAASPPPGAEKAKSPRTRVRGLMTAAALAVRRRPRRTNSRRRRSCPTPTTTARGVQSRSVRPLRGAATPRSGVGALTWCPAFASRWQAPPAYSTDSRESRLCSSISIHLRSTRSK